MVLRRFISQAIAPLWLAAIVANSSNAEMLNQPNMLSVVETSVLLKGSINAMSLDRQAGKKPADKICGLVELVGASKHEGVTVEVRNSDFRTVSDASGLYCLPHFEGTRQIVAWKRGWTVGQLSHVFGSPQEALPMFKLYTAPESIKAALLVEQYGILLWISTSRTKYAAMMADFETYKGWWIGGVVIEDPSQEHGFHFDPETVVIAQFTVEDGQGQGLQTTLPRIKQYLDYHKGYRWYVAPRFLETKDLNVFHEKTEVGARAR